jgi:hypothetical protein
MNALAWLRRYAAHPGPKTAAANLVALVIAGNGPFYPLYVLALIGWDRAGAWKSVLASPLFFAVPALSSSSPRATSAGLRQASRGGLTPCPRPWRASAGLRLPAGPEAVDPNRF